MVGFPAERRTSSFMQCHARLSKYRCIPMFAAATHPDAEVQFAFGRFRGEDACWSINAQDAFVRCC
jgi:hypothetical protein